MHCLHTVALLPAKPLLRANPAANRCAAPTFARVNRRRIGYAFLTFGVAALLGLLALDALFPLRRPAAAGYSPVVLAPDGTVLHATLNAAQQWRMYAPLAEISPLLQRAIVAKEDRWFWVHPGINPLAVVRAAWVNLTGRRTRPLGASTITMQVARLLAPKERTIGHKLTEALRALQLEWHLPKTEILALYLNHVPYGSNVQGVRAAALLYWQQAPAHLSAAQAVTLAVIPNDPAHLTPGRDHGRLLPLRDRWLRRLGRAGIFDSAAVADALREPVPTRRFPAPHHAPHLARRLLRQYAGRPLVRATLDPALQARAEQLTANYVARLRPLGIGQAAVLVVENRTRAVRAYVGSADFQDVATRGQVDGLAAVRSPGSTLKPLVYGLAIDQPTGGLTAASVLLDVPTDFGRGYRPANFDQHFHGALTTEAALALSLNVPAVRVLAERVGLPRLLDALEAADFRQIARDRPRLGLSTVLGGCGVRATELAGLYCALANGGRWGPLRLAEEEPEKPPAGAPKAAATAARETQLLAPEATWLVTQALASARRPDLPHEAESSARLPRVAWKTGTSYGRRDAWSVGYNPRYTICVWLGDFTGRGIPALTGADIGTPLLFDLFDLLDYRAPAGWFQRPEALERRLVCTESGLPPDTGCHSQGRAWYWPGHSEARRCDHQRLAWVAPDGRLSYCPTCRPAAAEGARAVLFPNPAPELVAWWTTQRLPPGPVPPPHNPACPLAADTDPDSRAPRIVAPASQTEIAFDPEDPTASLALRCVADPATRRVHWYLNDHYLTGAAPTDPVFCRPPRGWVKLSCADDRGRVRHSWVRVL